MIIIDHTLVSDDLTEEQFVCDLNRCKGACCVGGDMGAPLEEKELDILSKIYPQIKPYMSVQGIQSIEQQGLSVTDPLDGELTTPLIDGKECAFTVFENGIAQCSMELAWKDGKTDFQKPISCHLYPVRITPYEGFEAVNYHRWEVCAPACELGSKLKVPLYKFLEKPLTRKYGTDWYKQLVFAAKGNG
jgi:hypothetical protein